MTAYKTQLKKGWSRIGYVTSQLLTGWWQEFGLTKGKGHKTPLEIEVKLDLIFETVL